MTLLNVLLRPDAVVFLTDGIVFDGNRKPLALSFKLALFPEIPAAVAFTGTAGYARAVEQLRFSGAYAGVEELAEAVAVVARRAIDQAPEENPPGLRGYGIVAGWSRQREQFRAFYVGEGGDFTARPIPSGGYIQPRFTDSPPPWEPCEGPFVGLDWLEWMAGAQYEAQASASPDRPGLGGSLYLTIVTREETTVRVVGQLPGYEAIVREIREGHR